MCDGALWWMYQLGIEFGQSRLTSIVENEHSINHRGVVCGLFEHAHWRWHAGGDVKVEV
jgi:hypothetical protein